jgi:hypothetical protein
MGNSDSTPNNDLLSLSSAAPVWSRILTEISQDLPIAKFVKPDGLVEVEVDTFSGLLPGPGTVSTVKELFIAGTEPTRRDNIHVETDIDSATGLLWQDGCTGPKVTKTFLDFSRAEERFPQWQSYTQGWAERAARGVGVRGGPKRTATMYFYSLSFHPFGRTWGGKFKPTEVCSSLVACPPGVTPTPNPSTGVIPCIPEPSHGPPASTGPTPSKGGGGGKPTPTPSIVLPSVLPLLTGIATGEAPSLAMFPLLVPVIVIAIGRGVRPKLPKRPKRFKRARPN